MRYVYFECTEGNKSRFYRLTIQHGLFGPVLTREWGRIGTTGQLYTHLFDSWSDLDALYQDLFTARLQRGYRVVSSGGHEPPITLSFKHSNVRPSKLPDVPSPAVL